MPTPSTLADRVWFAYQCLPRDPRGNLPSWRELEVAHKLPNATFHRIVNGGRTEISWRTGEKIAAALRTSEQWLKHGGDNGPVPTGPVPPRPGVAWTRHGDLPGWKEAEAMARSEVPQRVPGAAYFAGADAVVTRPIDLATVDIVVWISGYAYQIATQGEKRRWEDQDIRDAERRQEERRAPRPLKRRVANVAK